MSNLNISITTVAELDLQNIFDYIAKDNRLKAVELIEIIEEKIKLLSMFPNRGYKKSNLLKRNVRECVVAKHYQIIYTIENSTVYILRVLTGYQEFFVI